MRILGIAALVFLCMQDPKEKLKDDCDQSWIYDDLGTGFAQAKKSGRPLMVVFR